MARHSARALRHCLFSRDREKTVKLTLWPPTALCPHRAHLHRCPTLTDQLRTSSGSSKSPGDILATISSPATTVKYLLLQEPHPMVAMPLVRPPSRRSSGQTLPWGVLAWGPSHPTPLPLILRPCLRPDEPDRHPGHPSHRLFHRPPMQSDLCTTTDVLRSLSITPSPEKPWERELEALFVW